MWSCRGEHQPETESLEGKISGISLQSQGSGQGLPGKTPPGPGRTTTCRFPVIAPNSGWLTARTRAMAKRPLIYLGRYLYRGVIREQDILQCRDGMVTFRYRHAKSEEERTRTVKGEYFLYLLMLHVLPRGFRRARSYGFLHSCSKKLIRFAANGAASCSLAQPCSPPEATAGNHLSCLRGRHGDHRNHDCPATGQSGQIHTIEPAGGKGYVNGNRTACLPIAGFHRNRIPASKKRRNQRVTAQCIIKIIFKDHCRGIFPAFLPPQPPDSTPQTKKLFSIYNHRACPTNGSDCGSLRSHNLTLFVMLI